MKFLRNCSKLLLSTYQNRLNLSKMTRLTYPVVKRDEQFSERIHDIDIPDPYRWLENDGEDVKQFCKDQLNLFESYIEEMPSRKILKEKLSSLYNYPKYGIPFKRGDYYYMSKNSGLQNQHVMYRFKNLNDEHELFLDPNTFSEDGTSSLHTKVFSKDNKWLAYSISKAGSDWLVIKIRNVDTKQDLPYQLYHVKSSKISWTHDNLGFFYSKFDVDGDVYLDKSDNKDHKVYYHRINTPQSSDVLVYDRPDHPTYYLHGSVSDCGKFLFLKVCKDCSDSLWYYAKLDENLPIEKKFTVYPIIETFGYEHDYITNNQNQVYFKTNHSASNYRICRLDLNSTDPANPNNWVEIVPEDSEAVIDDAICVDNDKIAIVYMRNVINQVEIYNLENGQLFKKFDIPIGTVIVSGRRENHEIFFYITSFLSPGQIYHYDFNDKKDEHTLFLEIKLEDFNAGDYETKQVFFETKDGLAKVPMFITKHKDVELDSNNPVLLYGYGGFSIPVQPYFSVSRLLFMSKNGYRGIFAVANIRGGNEYGRKWYDAGRLFNKQNSYDDFIQAAEYLIENGYTNKSKLIIEGGSNGGLMVAAVANQRPDLFGAVVAHVGVFDLLRFQKFTCGSSWICDYGDHEEESEKGLLHLKNQLKISPLHNVPKNGMPKYPAVLLLTSDHDNRVVPLHSFKYIAELQHTIGRRLDDSILLLRVEMNAGHGAGKSTEQLINASVDAYCFLEKALNLECYG